MYINNLNFPQIIPMRHNCTSNMSNCVSKNFTCENLYKNKCSFNFFKILYKFNFNLPFTGAKITYSKYQ